MRNGNPENFKEWWQTRPTWQKVLLLGFVGVSLLLIVGGSIALNSLDLM